MRFISSLYLTTLNGALIFLAKERICSAAELWFVSTEIKATFRLYFNICSEAIFAKVVVLPTPVGPSSATIFCGDFRPSKPLVILMIFISIRAIKIFTYAKFSISSVVMFSCASITRRLENLSSMPLNFIC